MRMVSGLWWEAKKAVGTHRDGHRTVMDTAIDKPSHYGHGHTRIRTVGIWSTTSTVSTVNNTVVTAVRTAMYSQSKQNLYCYSCIYSYKPSIVT